MKNLVDQLDFYFIRIIIGLTISFTINRAILIKREVIISFSR